MSKLLQTLLMAASLVLALGGEAPAKATPVEVAVDRCNGQTIDDASARLRDYDRHPPGA